MIQVLIDKSGEGHEDIILKIDAMPFFKQVGDLYYMADFLKVDPKKTNNFQADLGIEYINYVKNKLDNIDTSDTFIIFDISDQYIGGLLMKTENKGLIRTTYVSTNKIQGHEIDKETIDELISERNPIFDKDAEWILSETSIIEGLNWSVEKIKTSANIT